MRQSIGDSDDSLKSQMYWYEALDSPPPLRPQLVNERLENSIAMNITNIDISPLQSSESRNFAQREQSLVKIQPIDLPKLEMNFDDSEFDPFGNGDEKEGKVLVRTATAVRLGFEEVMATSLAQYHGTEEEQSIQQRYQRQSERAEQNAQSNKDVFFPPQRQPEAAGTSSSSSKPLEQSAPASTHPGPSWSQASSHASGFSTLPQDQSTPRAGYSTEPSTITSIAKVARVSDGDPFVTHASPLRNVKRDEIVSAPKIKTEEEYCYSHPVARDFIFPSPVAVPIKLEGDSPSTTVKAEDLDGEEPVPTIRVPMQGSMPIEEWKQTIQHTLRRMPRNVGAAMLDKHPALATSQSSESSPLEPRPRMLEVRRQRPRQVNVEVDRYAEELEGIGRELEQRIASQKGQLEDAIAKPGEKWLRPQRSLMTERYPVNPRRPPSNPFSSIAQSSSSPARSSSSRIGTAADHNLTPEGPEHPVKARRSSVRRSQEVGVQPFKLWSPANNVQKIPVEALELRDKISPVNGADGYSQDQKLSPVATVEPASAESPNTKSASNTVGAIIVSDASNSNTTLDLFARDEAKLLPPPPPNPHPRGMRVRREPGNPLGGLEEQRASPTPHRSNIQKSIVYLDQELASAEKSAYFMKPLPDVPPLLSAERVTPSPSAVTPSMTPTVPLGIGTELAGFEPNAKTHRIECPSCFTKLSVPDLQSGAAAKPRRNIAITVLSPKKTRITPRVVSMSPPQRVSSAVGHTASPVSDADSSPLAGLPRLANRFRGPRRVSSAQAIFTTRVSKISPPRGPPPPRPSRSPPVDISRPLLSGQSKAREKRSPPRRLSSMLRTRASFHVSDRNASNVAKFGLTSSGGPASCQETATLTSLNKAAVPAAPYSPIVIARPQTPVVTHIEGEAEVTNEAKLESTPDQRFEKPRSQTPLPPLTPQARAPKPEPADVLSSSTLKSV
jgi:hypothetical protein